MSGGLLAVAFAPLAWSLASWFALVPGLLAAARLPPRRAMRGGFLTGATFWLSSIFWLTRVTWAGWFLLALYCALYMIPFFGFMAWWKQQHGVHHPLANGAGMILGVVVWTGFEYVRSVFATGFAWNTLGTALCSLLPLLQVVRLGGAYLLSALIVWCNLALVFTCWRLFERTGTDKRWIPAELLTGLVVWGAAYAWGHFQLLHDEPATEHFRVALVQPNIPQDRKWITGDHTYEDYLAHRAYIHGRLRMLTQPISQTEGIDLIIWPETAIPDDLLSSQSSYELVFNLATNGVPILIGSMDTHWLDGTANRLYYNCSFLVETNGVVVQGYDKQHLVLFGEYVPFQETFPFLQTVTPIPDSFTAGTNSTLFQVARSPIPFSVLICFEDTVSHLARAAVRRGARLLVNQTNDAWFDPLSGSLQHVPHSVLRAVETGVPLVRSANTGVSCAIDRRGRILGTVRNPEGQPVRVAGSVIVDVPIPPAGSRPTLYLRLGDAPWRAVALFAIALHVFIIHQTRSSTPTPYP